ncbi:MAG: hypothetical protein HC809_10470 [Gammaproteobacteria bacterium]|nr:hypothetical protein [Gammaproteobacteria bacterium]
MSDLIQARLLVRTSTDWLAEFSAAAVTVNRVSIIEETLADEQITINAMAVPPVDPEVDVPLIINHPVKVSSLAQVGPRRAPELGEHTSEILRTLGYTDTEIDELRAKGAI